MNAAIPRHGVVVLAARASRRLARSKQLLLIEGETLVRRATLAALATQPAKVVIVVGADAFVNGIQKVGVGVGADAGVGIRRDVGGIHRAERQYEGTPTGEGLPAPSRVTSHAICRARQVFPALFCSVGNS